MSGSSCCARSVATRARTRSSSAHTRRSHSEWRTSSPATLPTPRTPSRTRWSRPGARSAASAPASRCGRGSSGSSRTRPATAAAPPAGASALALAARHATLGGGGPLPRGRRCSTRPSASDCSPRSEELPGGGARGARLPLPARALRGGDRGGARRRARHRQVAHGAGARPAEGGVWTSSVSSARLRRSSGRRRPQLALALEPRRRTAAGRSRRSHSRSRRSRLRFAVPQSRGAILRFFHLGADTIEFVDTLPPADERPLDAGLGAPVSLADARALGADAAAAAARPAADALSRAARSSRSSSATAAGSCS